MQTERLSEEMKSKLRLIVSQKDSLEPEQLAKLHEVLSALHAGEMQDSLDEKLRDRDGERVKLLGSFAYFCKEAWGWVEDVTLRWNWHHDILCDYLQSLQSGKLPNGSLFVDLIINVPPGASKSMFASVLWPAWCMAKDATERIWILSCSDQLIEDQSRLCKKLVVSDWYIAFFGDSVQIDPKLNRASYWRTTAGGWRRSMTTRQKPIGIHPNIIIYDDILSVDDASNEKERVRINEWHDKNMITRGAGSVLHRRRVNCQQRIHEKDMSGHLMESGKWHSIVIPMEFESGRMDDIGLGTDPRTEKGELLWEDMITPALVEEAKRGLGEDYYGQYQQRPTAAGGNVFKVNRINKIDYDEVPFDKIVRFKRGVDKAATHNGGCFTAAPLAGIVELENNHIQVYFIEMFRGQWSIDIVEENIKLYTQLDEQRFGRNRCETVVEEEGGSAGKQAAFDTMRNMKGLRVRVVPTAGKSKPSRWQPLANAVYRYEIYVVTSRNGKPVEDMLYLIQELQGQPKSQFKDATDAAALTYNELIHIGLFDLPDPEADRDSGEQESTESCQNKFCDRLAREESPYCCDCCKVIAVTGRDIRQMSDVHHQQCNFRHGNMSRSGIWEPNSKI